MDILILACVLLIGSVCAIPAVPLVVWLVLPERERKAGVVWTLGLGLLSGAVIAWSAYDSHDVKTGNISSPILGLLATSASMVLVALLLFGLSEHRRSIGDASFEADEGRRIDPSRYLPPSAC